MHHRFYLILTMAALPALFAAGCGEQKAAADKPPQGATVASAAAQEQSAAPLTEEDKKKKFLVDERMTFTESKIGPRCHEICMQQPTVEKCFEAVKQAGCFDVRDGLIDYYLKHHKYTQQTVPESYGKYRQ